MLQCSKEADMTKTSAVHPSDVLGFSRLAVDATAGLADLVEAMHVNIARKPGILGTPLEGPAGGITGLVYQSIRAINGLVGSGIDALLTPLIPLLGERNSEPQREAVRAALNGVMGDHLAATGNPLAIAMRLRQNGNPLVLERTALAAAIPQFCKPGNKLVLLAHGLCMSDLQWTRNGHNHGHNHGAALARDLGYTPVHLHYNSGLHISTNGHVFADLLETLIEQWPVPLEEFAIIGHSMGGLVARSGCYYAAAAGYDWPRRLRKLVFLGTPHHGAPLERGGAWINAALGLSPYTAAFARLGRIRSAGITDLRYGNLVDGDWSGRDRFRVSPDLRQPLALPESVQSYALAAAVGRKTRALTGPMGDGLVPVDSALGIHKDPRRTLAIPKSRQWVGYGLSHLDLLDDPAVYEQIRQCLLAPSAPDSRYY
jgi:pimeloyl-ACP methyl ester carboxylesterase